MNLRLKREVATADAIFETQRHGEHRGNAVVVELKAKSAIHPVDKAQVLSHLRLMNLRLGLLINFHEIKLTDGVSRIANGYS